MKKTVLFFMSLICLIVLISASSIKSVEKDAFDFNGTWIQTDDWEGCGAAGKDTWTIKITQQGDAIMFLNVERNHLYKGTQKGNAIFLKGIKYPSRYGGSTIVHDYKLTMSGDKNSFEGTMNWTWDVRGCEGAGKITSVRKVE